MVEKKMAELLLTCDKHGCHYFGRAKWNACSCSALASELLPLERLEQIRRAHASARPSPVTNPAWFHAHNDVEFLLHCITKLERHEYICTHCGIRKDGEVDGQPDF